MIKIYWLEYSFFDHPWKYSLILYTSWCNLKCYKCHNRLLSGWDYWDIGETKWVETSDYYKELDWDELILAINSWMIDMVILCWWEVLLYSVDEIKRFVDYIKSINNKLLIRIDTNWTFPKKVEELVKRWEIDWFAIDIKWPYWNNNYYSKIWEVMWIPIEKLEDYCKKIIQSIYLSKDLEYSIYRTVSYPIINDSSYFDEIKLYVKENLHKHHSFNVFKNV